MIIVTSLGPNDGSQAEVAPGVFMDLDGIKGSLVGKPVTLDTGTIPRPRIGEVVDAYTKDGRLIAEIEVKEGTVVW